MTGSGQRHWDDVYATRPTTDVSWYEPVPATSLELIHAAGLDPNEPIIDVGGGASFLAEALLDGGHTDLTVLDISQDVLRNLAARLGKRAHSVRFIHADVTTFKATRRYALWHDRAVFHFLTAMKDRESYVEVLEQALEPNSHVIISTFGPSGPERCSGLPVMRYDERALAAELGHGFKLLSSSLHAHRTPSGGDQQFIYCHFRRVPQ